MTALVFLLTVGAFLALALAILHDLEDTGIADAILGDRGIADLPPDKETERSSC